MYTRGMWPRAVRPLAGMPEVDADPGGQGSRPSPYDEPVLSPLFGVAQNWLKEQGQTVERHSDGAVTIDGHRYDAPVVERLAREWCQARHLTGPAHVARRPRLVDAEQTRRAARRLGRDKNASSFFVTTVEIRNRQSLLH